MLPYPYLPAAFVRGAAQSAFTNTNPPGPQHSALTNTNPPRSQHSALTNTNPPAQSAQNNTNPPSPIKRLDDAWRDRPWPQPSPAPAPWRGLDPDWVYDDMSSTMAQALRRSRAKVVRPSDIALTVADEAAAIREGENVKGSALWRWAPEWRITTVSGQLIGRFLVYEGALWLLNPGLDAQRRPVMNPVPVFYVGQGFLTKEMPWAEQVDSVLRAAVEREERLPEILSQADDFWPFFESVTGVPLAAAPYTSELLAAAHFWCLHLVMQLKHGVAALRPVQRNSLVMPVIATPGHGSVPSGHATMAAFLSELLHQVLYRRANGRPNRSQELDRLARRIAHNRVVAGVHFPVDSLVGYRLGTLLARLFLVLAEAPGAQLPTKPVYGVPQRAAGQPFETSLAEEGERFDPDEEPVEANEPCQVLAAPALVDLYGQAAEELDRLRV